MQVCCSTCSVILNVTATQYTCSLNGIYHPQWSCHCSCMRVPVHLPWLLGYIDVAQTILIILIMVGLFLDRPHILICQASCPVFALAEPTLMNEFLESYFNQWAETCPVPLGLCSSILTCIITNDSGSIMTNHNVIPISQDCAVWTKQCKFGLLISIKNGPMRDLNRHFGYVSRSPLCFRAAHLQFPGEGLSPWFVNS